MKIVILLALVTACVATPVARGGRNPLNVLVDADSQSKWDYIEFEFGGVLVLIEGFADEVTDIANSDNAEVGRVLSTHVNAAVIELESPIEQKGYAILNRTLTRDETTSVSERFEQILATYKTNTAEIILQLSQEAQDDIQNVYEILTVNGRIHFWRILNVLD